MVPYKKQDLFDHDEASNSSTGAVKRKKGDDDDDDDDEGDKDEDDSDAAINHTNQPVQTVIYREPRSRIEKVLILAALPGGVTDASFSLDGIGPGSKTGKITYRWPYPLIDYERIFSEETEERCMTKEHPKIEALRQELEKKRKDIDSRVPIRPKSNGNRRNRFYISGQNGNRFSFDFRKKHSISNRFLK